MRAFRIHILSLIFLFTLPKICAQQDSVSPSTNLPQQLFESVEERLSEMGDEVDVSDELEMLLQGQTGKINLNDVAAEVAYVILQLTDYQYYQLQLYIETYGELVSIYELAAVDGYDRAEVERIMPLVEVKPRYRNGNPFTAFFKRSHSTLLLRYRQLIEPQAGYADSAENGYAGSPTRLTFKYSFQSGEHFSMALSGEKDAGEEWFKGSQKQGFDHYAFFMQFQRIGILKSCVIGDYTLGFGQGITMGGRMMGVKGGGAAQIRRFPSLLRATAPMNESSNLRGVAFVIGNSYYSGTFFYSHRFFDGKTSRDSTGQLCFDGSLSNTGYHRTAAEIAHKNAMMNRQYGAHFQLNKRIFSLGITGMNTQFSIPVSPRSDLYQKYGFAGKYVANFSADFKVILRKTILFGEAGMSVCHKRTGTAGVVGSIFDLDPRVKFSALFRYYSRNFLSLSGSSFGLGSSSNGQYGLYLATDFVTSRHTFLTMNADFVQYDWLRYQIDKPPVAFDFGAKLSINPTRHLTANLKYQLYLKEQNSKESEYFVSVRPTYSHRIRAVIDCQPIDWLTLKTEADYLFNDNGGSKIQQGGLLYQDIGIAIDKIGLGIKLRFAIFDTDSYAERLYAYEQDLLYAFTINGYYGKGIRYYIVVNYGIAFFDLQIRFSQTRFDDRNSISSGVTLIEGNTKSEIAAQMIFHIN